MALASTSGTQSSRSRPSLKLIFKRQRGTNNWTVSQKSDENSSKYTFVSQVYTCPNTFPKRNVSPLMIRAGNSLGIFMYPYPVGFQIPKSKKRFLGYYSASAPSLIPLKIPDPDPNVQSLLLNYYGDGFCNGRITHRDFISGTPEELIQEIQAIYEPALHPRHVVRIEELFWNRRYNAWLESRVDPNHNEHSLPNLNQTVTVGEEERVDDDDEDAEEVD